MAVNARLSNIVANVGIKPTSPNVRISAFQTGHSGESATSIPAGTPIGLLLALTYAQAVSLPPYSDFRPNARIVNT